MSEESKRVLEILRRLSKEYPDAPATYLKYNNPFEMLIATILSARATDAGVNKVTPQLFGKYPTPKRLAEADIDDVAMIIRPCGAYNKKASYITETARMISEDYSGEIPKTMEQLIRFPGVSRKTANVVIQVVFGQADGIVVDTHIMRVTIRLGFSEHDKKPERIERELMELLPKDKWINYARLIGTHGRQTCKSQRPKCFLCPISNLCPSSEAET
ncbi:endonuclease III [Candidatus Thorarchaeota archaeon]|nr:MAG: endonuclease III [Candidatus Thorarchaeota archaeon]